MKAQKRNEMGVRKERKVRGGNGMFSNLSFIGKWKRWYRVLRYRKAFGRLHSVRYGSGWRVAEGEDSPCLEWKS
jgi:hypothetical protein